MRLTNTLECDGGCGKTEEVKMRNPGVGVSPRPESPKAWIHLEQRTQIPSDNPGGDWFLCSWECVKRWAETRA